MAEKKKIKVWTDGCFDMMHWGHANALRQSKALGDYLVVGVHSDAEILKNKGPPVMTEKERYEAVRACKWVDEVVEDAPYITQLDVMEKYGCDFCVHGDDISTTHDGEDTYGLVKAAGKFRTVPRTQGVSTTQLVGRMLLLTTDHHSPYYNDRIALGAVATGNLLLMSEGEKPKVSPYTGLGQYLPTSRRIVQFSEGREPQPNDTVVYIDGTFDLFHSGHAAILKEARKLGDYLIVGILPDDVVNQKKGYGWPVMNLHERVLSVLSCRYVDEVIIGAPWAITEDFIKSQKIHVVVRGTICDAAYKVTDIEYDEAFEAAAKLGILKSIVSPMNITTSGIVQRIIDNRSKFVERNTKKEAKEVALENKEGEKKIEEQIVQSDEKKEQVVQSDEKKEQVVQSDEKKEQVVQTDEKKEQIVQTDEKKEQVVQTDEKKEQVVQTDEKKEQVVQTDEKKEQVVQTDEKKEQVVQSDEKKEQVVQTDVKKEVVQTEVVQSDEKKEQIVEKQ